MKTLRPLVLAIAFALASCSGGGGSSNPVTPSTPGGTTSTAGLPPALPTLPEVASIDGVATVSLTAKFDANGRPAFFYNGGEVAPTIRVQPGDSIKLHFVNTLPEDCAVGVVSNANLHFHGLVTSPNAPADDSITTNAAPGAAVDYVVPINATQAPGLYWYHPHAHGLASYEVGNGMAGAIVVEGIANFVPQTAGLRERVVILQDVPNDPSYAAGESSIERRQEAATRTHTRTRDDADSPTGGDLCAPETDATPMINGLPQTAIGIKPGETELIRVVNATGHRHFDLNFSGLPMTIVAQDGVPIADYPGAPQSLAVTDWVVPPAGRVEFLITGPKSPTPMRSLCYKSGPGGDTDPQVALGYLADDTTWAPPSQATLTDRVRAASKTRRAAFSLQQTPLPAPAAAHTIHFSEDTNGFYLDGAAYDPNAAPAITAHSGTVEEWTLENLSTEVHAFHIHQVHFIVESINGVAQPNPHWEDVVDIPPVGVGVQGQTIPSETKILIDFRDPIIRGTFLYHCHILDHEDGGMMAKIAVV